MRIEANDLFFTGKLKTFGALYRTDIRYKQKRKRRSLLFIGCKSIGQTFLFDVAHNLKLNKIYFTRRHSIKTANNILLVLCIKCSFAVKSFFTRVETFVCYLIKSTFHAHTNTHTHRTPHITTKQHLTK